MWAATARAFLLACIARAPVGAIRTEDLDQGNLSLAAASLVQTGDWETKAHYFCIQDHSDLECDEDSVIRVKSAFYNARKKDPTYKGQCAPSTLGQDKDCGKDAKLKVQALCDGHRSCKFAPEVHRACEAHPFTFMRIVYGCEAGPPNELVEEVETKVQQEEVPEVPQQMPPKAAPATSTTTPREEPDVEDKAVVIKGSKGLKVVKALEKQQSRMEDIEMVPCYRLDRATLTWRNYKNWNGRLTNCGEHEGCFKLKWWHPPRYAGVEPERRYFKDEEQAPTMAELLEGELSTEGDSMLVTFLGIGIQRSSYWTWGICLPKTQGLEYAINTWSNLVQSWQAMRQT